MKAWRLTPREWARLSVDDRAQMTAYELVESAREGYVAEKQAEEMKKDPKTRQQEGASNAYQRQRRQWGLA